MGDMLTFKVFEELFQRRAVQRTSNQDIKKCRSGAKSQKTRKRQNLVFQSQLRLSKFLCFHQFLAHFLTSGGSKNFCMDDILTFKVFEELF